MKFKILLSIFLAITMLPVFSGYSATANIDSDGLYQQRYELLKGIGVVRNAESMEDTEVLSRAQFASLIVDAANVVRYAIVPEKEFADVTKEHKYYDSIYTACEYGFISTGEYFSPDEGITLEEASVILCKALGYTILAQNAGGYPGGYMKVAYEYSLFDNIDSYADDKISFCEAVNIIYNFVNAELFEITFKNSGISIEKLPEENILSLKYNIFSEKGIINANGYTDLLAADSGIRENEVKINDVIYIDNNSLAGDYLGYYTKVYYKVDPDTDFKNIVYVDIKDKNVVKTISAKDLNDCTASNIMYEDDKDKIHKLSISPTMSFIVNGKMKLIAPQYIKSIAKGELTLISNDGDSTYDICIVSEYTTSLIAGVGTAEQLLVLDNGTKIDFRDENYINIIIKNGKKISFYDLKTDDVVMFSESSGEGLNKRTFLVTDAVLNDKISNINDEKIEIAGVSYSFDKGINEKIKVGNFYKIYLDYYGNICYILIADEIVYGYLYDTQQKTGIDDSVKFKIFTENNRVVTLNVREKVSLNGSLVKAYELTNPGSISYIAPKQMIRYKVNQGAEIVMLETAETIKIGSQQEKKAIEEDKFRISFNDTSTWRSGSKTFDGMFYADKFTKIFVIPDENDISTFNIKDINSFSGDSQYTITAYDADDFHVVKAIMMKDLTKKINHNSKFMIVTGTGTILNSEEEIVPRLEGYWSGDKMEFPVKINEKLTAEQISALKRGDLILFTYDDLGNVDQIERFGSKFYISAGRYSYFTVIGGIVSKIDYTAERITVNYLGDNNATFSDCCLIFNGKTAVYIYNRVSNSYQIASTDDIMPGDEVYMNSSYLTCKEIIIIR